MGKLLTMVEAAEQLRISRRTLDRYVDEGMIVKTKIGRKSMIEERELEKFIRRGRAS